MQKHGLLKNGELLIVPPGTPGAKPIIYEAIPDFDQETQAVYQTEPVDMGDHIYVGVEIRDVEQDDGEQHDEMY